MLQFGEGLIKFPGADFEISLSQVFKWVFKIYMMSRFMTIFDPIFRIYGIFYDICYPFLDPKVPFCC